MTSLHWNDSFTVLCCNELYTPRFYRLDEQIMATLILFFFSCMNFSCFWCCCFVVVVAVVVCLNKIKINYLNIENTVCKVSSVR